MALISLGCNCEPDCPPINGTPGPPGPTGPAGPTGATGNPGLNAYGVVFAAFQMPAVGANVSVSVNNAQWATPNQTVYVMGAGYFQVAQTSTLYTMVLTNLGLAGNAAPGTTIPVGQQVSPAGPPGTAGEGTMWYTGSGAPVSTGAETGDLYLDTVSGNIFQCLSGA